MAPNDARSRAAAEKLERLARRLERDLAASFREAVEVYRKSPAWKPISEAVNRGDISRAIDLLNRQGFDAHAEAFSRGLQRALEAAGDLGTATVREAVEGMPGAGGETIVPVQFNLRDPRTAEMLRDYQAYLIREVTEEQRRAAEASLLDGMERGDSPIATARKIRRNIGLHPMQQRWAESFEAKLRSDPLRALDNELRDRRFDPSIRRAARGDAPLSEREIARMVQRYRERALKYRSEVIGRTESVRMTRMGFREAWRQNVEGGPLEGMEVRRYWSTSDDEKVRSSHRAAEDLNSDGVGVDEPFRMGSGARLMYPGDPNGPAAETINCRCVEIYEVGPRGRNS